MNRREEKRKEERMLWSCICIVAASVGFFGEAVERDRHGQGGDEKKGL